MSDEKTLSQNCFKQWEVEIYVVKNVGQLTKVGTLRRLKKLSSLITKTRGSKYNFALSAH